MQLGIQIDRFTNPDGDSGIAATLSSVAQRAEEAGFSSVWVMDHFFQLPHIGPIDDPMLEGYTALAYAAARTERVKLGTLVTSVTYRHPGVLVKTATTLDVLSGGRAYFGVGAGWFEREHLGLGIPFPPLKERFERLEEMLQITHQMWSGDVKPYEGTHYQLAETLGQPMPLSRPHPPILIGGGGEQKTLRFVARYGDACNLVAFRGHDALAHKLEVLRGHCETEGRPYEEIEKTALDLLHVTPDGHGDSLTPAAAVERLQPLAELGFDHVMVKVPNAADPATFALLAEQVVPRVNAMAVAGR